MRTKWMLPLLCLMLHAPALAQTQPLPHGVAGTVTLPVAQYDQLLDRAGQPRPAADVPPVPAVVGRAQLRARIDAGIARGTLRLDGEVFQRGAVKVPLVRGATLLDARMDGGVLPLLHASGVHAAVLHGPAPFSVVLEWAATVASAPGRATLVLPQPTAGSVDATIDLPGEPADIRVQPGIVTRRQTAAGRTVLEIMLEPSNPTQVSWSVREASATTVPADARTLSDVKSLVTIGEADLRMVSVVEINVVRGDAATFTIDLPRGYELTAITGSSLEASEPREGSVRVMVRDGSLRQHQFLLVLEQPHPPGSFKIDTGFPTVAGVQRETGETAIEGVGTVEVAASGDDSLRRMDVREINRSLQGLAREAVLAAFRYQRHPGETRVLTLDVRRFPDAAVIPAIAEHATATTLVTSEGRTLTEVVLRLRNRAQPFMRVTLPRGATMLSVDVAGEPAKPVIGADGVRVPLLRTGFRPNGPYAVSFVYLHAGEAFARRGDAQMALPLLDVPVNMLDWELFLPDRYAARPVAGNVIPASLVARPPGGVVAGAVGGLGAGFGGGIAGGVYRAGGGRDGVLPGQISGRISDPTGAAVPGANITVSLPGGEDFTTVSDANGFYVVRGVPSGRVTVTSRLPGFAAARRTLSFDQRPRRVDLRMEVGAVSESVMIRSEEAPVELKTLDERAREELEPQAANETAQQAPSQNIVNLQRRVAGVLPVRVDVPRAGTSYRFVKPLVLDEATTVSFRYKARR